MPTFIDEIVKRVKENPDFFRELGVFEKLGRLNGDIQARASLFTISLLYQHLSA